MMPRLDGPYRRRSDIWQKANWRGLIRCFFIVVPTGLAFWVGAMALVRWLL